MKRGFTLVELMIVVAIMSILAAVSAPKFSNQIKRSKDARVLGALSSLRSASRIYHSDEFEYTEKMEDLLDTITHNELLYQNLNVSGSAITSYQMQAGTVVKLALTSEGKAGTSLEGKENIAEIYYDNTDGSLYVDGTTGSGIGFLDSKEKVWNEY